MKYKHKRIYINIDMKKDVVKNKYKNCLYYMLCFCFFCTLPILYMCILLFLLAVSCPVAVFLLHFGPSVTITNSLYV